MAGAMMMVAETMSADMMIPAAKYAYRTMPRLDSVFTSAVYRSFGTSAFSYSFVRARGFLPRPDLMSLGLAFDDYHRQRAPDAVEPANLPNDGLLDLLSDAPIRMGD
jgi:hypothetical protein